MFPAACPSASPRRPRDPRSGTRCQYHSEEVDRRHLRRKRARRRKCCCRTPLPVCLARRYPALKVGRRNRETRCSSEINKTVGKLPF
jgi:hypothetical protein